MYNLTAHILELGVSTSARLHKKRGRQTGTKERANTLTPGRDDIQLNASQGDFNNNALLTFVRPVNLAGNNANC